MRFLAFSPPAAYALLAGVAALVVLLYLLRARPRRMVVASNLIWRRLAEQGRRPRERWRWLVSLALALATALSVALALTRPEVAALTGTSKQIVLIVDDSASMATRTGGGATRLARAQARARDILRSAGVASEFMLLDTMGYAGVAGWVDANAARAALDKLRPITIGTPRLPPLPSASDARVEVYFLTDGVAALEPPAGVRVESMFEVADNAAIAAFDARALPRDPTRYQAFVQVFNASKAERRVSLRLSGGAQYEATRELVIPAGYALNEIFDVSEFAGGVLRANVAMAGDAFDLDDNAYAVVMPHAAKRVLLVSAGNRPLEDSLKLLPGVSLTVAKPANYSPAANFDAYVFDRYAPGEPPPAGALLFHAGAVAWTTAPAAEAKRPEITRWDEAHPLAASVSWRDIKLERAALLPLDAAGARPLVIAKGASEGAVVSLASAGTRRVEVGFALPESNLALQSGFPVFLARALDWLALQPEPQSSELGSVEVALANAQVTDLDGKSVSAVQAGQRTLFFADRPGVFTLSNGQGRLQVVVNLLEPHLSEINRSRFADAATPAPTALPVPRWPVELAMLLLLLAAILLVVEWITYSRRITV